MAPSFSAPDESQQPRLRNVQKVQPPYPLNRFPASFSVEFAKQIVYILATASQDTIEGPEWERIFAACIGADWTPSNVGLDDIRLGVCAWGAKSIKSDHPFTAKRVRLISGRNSPSYSFNENDLGREAHAIGKQVLQIWNGRVESLRNTFSHLRTVVLIKGPGLLECAIFEMDTVLYPPDRYRWEKNDQNNLEGYDNDTGDHRFTWQPHGSQFTIMEKVPDDRLCLRIKKPAKLNVAKVIEDVGFDSSWVEIVRPS